MAPVLHYAEASPPVRAVLMCAKHINLQLERKLVDVQKGDNKTPEYLKMNPQGTIPVLVDGEATIWDSHAIMIYLVRKYGRSGFESLYPNDLGRHLLVHQMMHFENGVLFFRGRSNILVKMVKYGKRSIDEADADALREACTMLDGMLQGRKYAIGGTLTIADFSLVATVTSLRAFLPQLDVSQYGNIKAWLERVQVLPAYQENVAGVQNLIEAIAAFKKIIGFK